MEFTGEGNLKAENVPLAGQTWTRKLRCVDPSCTVDHAAGEQHEWSLEKEGVNGDTVPAGAEEYRGPADRIVFPLDVLSSPVAEDEEVIHIVGTRGSKVTRIGGLEPFAETLQELVLRSNLISEMSGVEALTMLTKLELYDNQLEAVSHISALTKLTILDLSFNCIRDMAPVSACPLLEELYLAQNKLKSIEGIRGMKHLRCLDLGANRIRSLQNVGLETLSALESLWLGKNKIDRICGIQGLSKLRQLDCQNNRLDRLSWDDTNDVDSSVSEGSRSGISQLESLQELYLACNSIREPHGLPVRSPLRTLDLSSNGVEGLGCVPSLRHLEELWMTSSHLDNFDKLQGLRDLPLECLYLEHSPLAADFEYRKKLTALVPTLQQIDATSVNRP